MVGLPIGLFAPLHDNDRFAPVENMVNLPLVLRLLLQLDDSGGGGVAECDAPQGFECIYVCRPFAVPVADREANLIG